MTLVGERQECRSHLCKDLVGTDLVCMGEKWTSCSSSVRKNVMYTLSLSTWHSTLPWLHPFSVFPYVCIETRCFWPWVTSHLFGRAESSRQIRSADMPIDDNEPTHELRQYGFNGCLGLTGGTPAFHPSPLRLSCIFFSVSIATSRSYAS